MARKRLAFKASLVEVVVQFEFPLLTLNGPFDEMQFLSA
jgi:hypothetical protein